jgi:hypothetical protein
MLFGWLLRRSGSLAPSTAIVHQWTQVVYNILTHCHPTYHGAILQKCNIANLLLCVIIYLHIYVPGIYTYQTARYIAVHYSSSLFYNAT